MCKAKNELKLLFVNVCLRPGGFTKFLPVGLSSVMTYFKENDYCRRGKEMNLNAFQLNKIIIRKKGQTVEFDRKKEQLDLQNLLSWHFIWSKFYFSQKKNGRFISIIIFLPILLRTILKIFYFKIIKEKKKITKYKYRYKGLIASMKGKKSYLRL